MLARDKVLALPALLRVLRAARAGGRRIVFTNGCFDLLHAGHVQLLERARAEGGFLVVGVNSDRSVRALKGPPRPIVSQRDRMLVLAGLASVDAVIVFDDPTPARLIARIQPDVLVKGADWETGEIVGRATVERHGGRVVRVPLVRGQSTSSLVDRIVSVARRGG